jgi:two-component system NtrC family response regulator
MKKKTVNILIIDDDASLATVTRHQLQGMGFQAGTALSGSEGLQAWRAGSFDLILLDLQMPDMSGMEVLREIRKQDQQVAVVIITAYGTVDTAVQACHQGADDFLTKPFAKEQLRFTIEKVLRLKHLESENLRLSREVSEQYQFGQLVTRDPALRELIDMAERAAQSDASVLITGESGTGKELLARAIHYHSPRKEEPFIAVNCPSIPETLIESELFGHEKGAFTGADRTRTGKFEQADGGTIFLDEIGDLRIDLQTRLLRVLQEHEIERVGGSNSIDVDVRVLAATNHSLQDKIHAGQFREDLYYRLNVIPMHIPPLRERKDDIPVLTDHFIGKYSNRPLMIDKDFLRELYQYDWPGNVRELENVIQRAVVLCSGNTLLMDCAHWQPESSAMQEPTSGSLPQMEKQAIIKALEEQNGNQTRAAKQLGIPRHVLIYRMKKYDLSS